MSEEGNPIIKQLVSRFHDRVDAIMSFRSGFDFMDFQMLETEGRRLVELGGLFVAAAAEELRRQRVKAELEQSLAAHDHRLKNDT